MRTKAARDHNEPAIVDALRRAGYHVTRTNDPGLPDLVVIRPDGSAPVEIVDNMMDALAYAQLSPLTLLEVKRPGEKLTDRQKTWWRGAGRLLDSD